MVKKSSKKRVSAARVESKKKRVSVQPESLFTIAEFCAAARISRSTYQRMKADGRGPYETRINGRLLISDTEKTRWLKAQVEPRGRYIDLY